LKREDFAEGRFVLFRSSRSTPRVIAFNCKLSLRAVRPGQNATTASKELLYGAHVYVVPTLSATRLAGRGKPTETFSQTRRLVKRTEKPAKEQTH